MRCIVCDEYYQGYNRRFSPNNWETHVNGSPVEVIKHVGTFLRGIVEEGEIIRAVHGKVNISKIVIGITWSRTVSRNCPSGRNTNLESDREMFAQ